MGKGKMSRQNKERAEKFRQLQQQAINDQQKQIARDSRKQDSRKHRGKNKHDLYKLEVVTAKTMNWGKNNSRNKRSVEDDESEDGPVWGAIPYWETPSLAVGQMQGGDQTKDEGRFKKRKRMKKTTTFDSQTEASVMSIGEAEERVPGTPNGIVKSVMKASGKKKKRKLSS